MSNPRRHKTETNSEHGTTSSYVVGFLLSLICTFIPYYMVVHQTVTGTVLLGTILGFAVVQMLIQVIFFLHIGRGKKPNWNVYFLISTVGIIVAVVFGSIFIMHNLHYNMSPDAEVKKLVAGEGIAQIGGQETGACQELHANHIVTINNGVVSPSHTDAHKCDTLTFINLDNVREMAFGEHPHHVEYAGVTELVIRQGKSATITLSETGFYNFHDHLDEATNGSLTVNP